MYKLYKIKTFNASYLEPISQMYVGWQKELRESLKDKDAYKDDLDLPDSTESLTLDYEIDKTELLQWSANAYKLVVFYHIFAEGSNV